MILIKNNNALKPLPSCMSAKAHVLNSQFHSFVRSLIHAPYSSVIHISIILRSIHSSQNHRPPSPIPCVCVGGGGKTGLCACACACACDGGIGNVKAPPCIMDAIGGTRSPRFCNGGSGTPHEPGAGDCARAAVGVWVSLSGLGVGALGLCAA